MSLTGKQFKQLQDALLNAYRNPSDLKRMVRSELDENLVAIAGDGLLTDTIYNLIEWADARGRATELATKASAYIPGNAALQAIAAELQGQAAPAAHTPTAPSQQTTDTNKGDIYTPLETGLETLLQKVDQQHQDHPKVLVWKQRLTANISASRVYGDTKDRQAERAEIVDQLNRFALPLLNQSFDELCVSPPSPPAGALRVFLGYAEADEPAVRELYQKIKREGFDPWMESQDGVPGRDPSQEIREVAKTAGAVLICLSERVWQAGQINRQIRMALDTADEQPEGAIYLIPVRLEPCAKPDKLEPFRSANLYEDNGYEMLFRALRMRADTVSGKAPPQPFD